MGPTLVLLPGMDGTGDLFAPLVAALGPHMRTVIVRYPDEPLDYASDEEIARAALPIGHPFILLGESFSGPIAVSIAASAPRGSRAYIFAPRRTGWSPGRPRSFSPDYRQVHASWILKGRISCFRLDQRLPRRPFVSSQIGLGDCIVRPTPKNRQVVRRVKAYRCSRPHP
jgi:pimeloyl-ACP methyl ester carboxylesterase